MTKRLIRIILILSLFPIEGNSTAANHMGKCGADVYWELSESGVLTISGKGKMECNSPDYPYSTGGPWRNIQSVMVQSLIVQHGVTYIPWKSFWGEKQLKSITLSDTVEEIGDDAFRDCSNLVSINLGKGLKRLGNRAFSNCNNLLQCILPNSLEVIEASAFSNCKKLRTVTIPNKVKKIGDRAFSGCTSLISVSIADGVDSLGWETFSECDNLTSITIPKSVNNIDNSAFSDCTRLTNIFISPENAYYHSIDGVLITKDGVLLLYPPGKIGDYSIPQSIKQIASNAFSGCSGLTSITIPNSVEAIGEAAFIRCGSLSTVVLPGSVQSIGVSAFLSCDNLTSIYVPQKDLLRFERMGSMMEVIPLLSARDDLFIGSDIEIDIPILERKNNNTFAVIIANEQYVNEEDVPFAISDGKYFSEYCKKVLSIPSEHIHYRENATLNILQQDIEWLKQIAEAYNGQAKIIFYYSGHGIPDEKEKSAFLLPVDGDGRMPSTAYSLDNLYRLLSEYPSEQITVFLDACFSGNTRSGISLDQSGRGVAISVKKGHPQGNMVVFTASEGNQTAYPYQQQSHGMFTYYLLKILKDTQGEVTYEELADYISTNVKQQSLVQNGKLQSPTIMVSPTVDSRWKNWKLY